MDLRVENPKISEEFAAIAPHAPLPWRLGDVPGVILDADGQVVAITESWPIDHRKMLLTASMVVVAVNTCGDFKIETT